MPEEKTWGQVWREPALLISFWVTGQFFALIVLFGTYPIKMDPEAKMTILQAYVVAFSAVWGYWLGSSAGSKQKDALLAAKPAEPVQVKT